MSMTVAGRADVFLGNDPTVNPLQESGTERASVCGGPDEDLGRGFAAQAATD